MSLKVFLVSEDVLSFTVAPTTGILPFSVMVPFITFWA
jgi:hypothetical protein